MDQKSLTVGDRAVFAWHDDVDGPFSPYWISDSGTVEAVTEDEVTVVLDHPKAVDAFEDEGIVDRRFFQFGDGFIESWFVEPIGANDGQPRRFRRID